MPLPLKAYQDSVPMHFHESHFTSMLPVFPNVNFNNKSMCPISFVKYHQNTPKITCKSCGLKCIRESIQTYEQRLVKQYKNGFECNYCTGSDMWMSNQINQLFSLDYM